METVTTSADPDLANQLIAQHPEDAARILEQATAEEIADYLEGEDPLAGARVIGRVTPDLAADALAALGDEPAARLLASMYPQRAASLLARCDPEVREARLSALHPDLAGELRELMSFPPDCAGALMDPRVAAFAPDTSVGDVIHHLRGFQVRRLQDVFTIDAEGLLMGSVRLVDVVLAGADASLQSLVRRPPISVKSTAPREELVETIEAHRLDSLPVVDFDGRLIGVLRQEQLIAAAEQSAAGDLVAMVGAGRDERALSPPLFAVRKRLPWLQINLLTAFLAASVVGIFEGTIAKFTALAVLLPVVAGQSGNTGAQALAVTMRGLALREIRARHWFRVTAKEVFVGAANGVAVAVTTSAAVWVWSQSAGLALVIGVSMVISMTAAGLAGASIPMMLTALRQDPAQSSSILLTTVTDVVGFFSFLGIATALSGMLAA